MAIVDGVQGSWGSHTDRMDTLRGTGSEIINELPLFPVMERGGVRLWEGGGRLFHHFTYV